MNFFLDAEFIERGRHFPIELISLGIVAEDGRELYCTIGTWTEEGTNHCANGT
jgi:hypothetical protein